MRPEKSPSKPRTRDSPRFSSMSVARTRAFSEQNTGRGRADAGGGPRDDGGSVVQQTAHEWLLIE
jgi:hypothetical protein